MSTTASSAPPSHRRCLRTGVAIASGKSRGRTSPSTAFMQKIVALTEKLEKLRLEIRQREFAISGKQKGTRDLVRQLETNILDEAHIVFTTLNSAALECFCHTDAFSAVVIDEAAQATELASLIPLMSSKVERVVLVGDPQQLRATAFSTSVVSSSSSSSSSSLSGREDAARAAAENATLQRSLFRPRNRRPRDLPPRHTVPHAPCDKRVPAHHLLPRPVERQRHRDLPPYSESFHVVEPFMFLNVGAARHAAAGRGERWSNAKEARKSAVQFGRSYGGLKVYEKLKQVSEDQQAPLRGSCGHSDSYRSS